MDYYLLINDRPAGPFANEQLRSMWTGGLVTVDTFYWKEGMPQWLQLRTIMPELEISPPGEAARAKPTKWRKTPPPSPKSGAKVRVFLAGIALGLLLAGAGGFVLRVMGGGDRGTWSQAADAELRRCLREFVGAGVQLDSMARQDPDSLAFGRQLDVAVTAFEFPSQSWPHYFAPHAREEFEAAVEGWRLMLQIRKLHVGESYDRTNNPRVIAALEAYAPGRVEYDSDPALKGFIPFEPNIRTLLAVASAHFTAGCGHLEKYYGK